MHARVIEVYFDPAGHVGGYDGCFRARLRDDHGCHSAGRIPQEAVEGLLRTIRSFQVFEGQENFIGLPFMNSADYQIIRLASYGGPPIPGEWYDRDFKKEADEVEAQRTASSIVAYMLYSPSNRF